MAANQRPTTTASSAPTTSSGAPPQDILTRPAGAQATPPPSSPAAVAKPNATDRIVIACPFCTTIGAKLCPEKGKGPDWTRAECSSSSCKRMFKVPDHVLKPKA